MVTFDNNNPNFQNATNHVAMHIDANTAIATCTGSVLLMKAMVLCLAMVLTMFVCPVVRKSHHQQLSQIVKGGHGIVEMPHLLRRLLL
jgi:hypothetical protein